MSNWFKKPKTDINIKQVDSVPTVAKISPDFILVYVASNKKLDAFKTELRNIGLKLHIELTKELVFMKIHAPQEVLYLYAELLHIRMPLKFDSLLPSPKSSAITKYILKLMNCRQVKSSTFTKKNYKLFAEFSRQKTNLFDESNEHYFDSVSRILIITYILEKLNYGELLNDETIKASYPVHDGSIRENCQRGYLFREWGSLKNIFKMQPLDELKDYFGVRIALYFAWLEFYTQMLIPASIAGIVCILYGIYTLNSDHFSREICTNNITMCPLCDKFCPYWQLKKTCIYAKLSYLVDNESIICFAIFMTIWNTSYLILWKRYSAELVHNWGISKITKEAEPPRPEFIRQMKDSPKTQINFITFLREPFVNFWSRKVPAFIFSFSIVILWMLIVVMVAFGIIMYRMALVTSHMFYDDSTPYKIYFIPITAAFINLIGILILGMIYKNIACKLTESEFHRTQRLFDESLSLKIYLFQVVNYYTCIFYIAFIKGRFIGYPKEYNRIFGYRQEECPPGGCLIGLTIQLGIIMVGKQAVVSFIEYLYPVATVFCKKYILKKNLELEDTKRRYKQMMIMDIECNQCISDYFLAEWNVFNTIGEYIEMLIQFGMVTLFVVAFPLAPLFAYINNIFELRLDAKKMLKYHKRPIPRRVSSIGVWLNILEILSRVSIITNAVIIGFSSEFIPKLVYSFHFYIEHESNSYVEFITSQFNTKHFLKNTAPLTGKLETCSYIGFRNPPNHPKAYERTSDYWIILVIRLLFVIIYQNMMSCLTSMIEWLIAVETNSFKNFIAGEDYQIKERILFEERRARKKIQTFIFRDEENQKFYDAQSLQSDED